MTLTPLAKNTLIVKNERIAALYLTIAARTGYSAREHVLRLIYTQALLAGAGAYSREALQDALGLLGATIAISLDDADIDITVQTIDTSLKKTLAILDAVIREPHFADAEIARIQTYLTNNLRHAKENARAQADHVFSSAFFDPKDRRASYDVDTMLGIIPTITTDEVRSFHASLWNYAWHYTVGGSEETAALCEKVLERLSRKEEHTRAEYTVLQTRTPKKVDVQVIDVPSKQNIEFCIGGSFPFTRAHALYPACVFATYVLGLPGGFVGRLMSIVREKEGLTYGIYARIEDVTMQETGVWKISTFFAPKDAVQGVASTLREVRRMLLEGISEDELMRFKSIISTRYALIGDSLLRRVAERHNLSKIGMTEAQHADLKDALMKLTRKEVNAAIQTFLDPKAMVISAAGPVGTVRKKLLEFKKG